jgi:hypothetical protein
MMPSPLAGHPRRRGSVVGALLALLVWEQMLPARTAAVAPDCLLSCPGVTGPAGPVACFDFTTTTANGDCGEVHNGVNATGTLVKRLRCGGLDVGGGASAVAEGPTPDGATTRFCIVSCSGNACTLGPSTSSSSAFDCSAAGCFFGPPLPISNAGTSTCVVNTWHGPGGGTLDVVQGSTSNLSVPLDSQIFLTGNALQPCPLCRQGAGMEADAVCAGTPDDPCAGVCDSSVGGPNQGLPCVSTNAQGLSRDCPSGGTFLGTLFIPLDPLTTGTATLTDPDGFLCPGQDPNDLEPGQLAAYPGCLGTTPAVDQTNLCRTITVHGSPAGSLLPPGTVQPMTLASVFCIPRTGSLLVDLAAALPGPGAVTLAGNAVLLPPAAATTTTTTTTTLPNGCAVTASFDSLLCRIDVLASLVSQGGVAPPVARTLLRLAGRAHRQIEDAEARAARRNAGGARRKLGAANHKLRALGHRVGSLAGRRGIPALLRDQLGTLAAAIRHDALALGRSL